MRQIKVTFNNEPVFGHDNKDNYTFTSPPGYALAATAVTVTGTKTVVLDLNEEMLDSGVYSITAHGIRDIHGSIIYGTVEFIGVGQGPHVDLAESTDNYITVTFSEDMDNDSELTNPDNYSITYTCDSIPWSFTIPPNAENDITVTFSRDMDIDEDLCDPLNYTITLATLPSPLTYSTAMSVPKEATITYSNIMNINSELINTANYSISISSTPDFSYTAEATAAGEVTVTFNNMLDMNTDLVDITNYEIIKV